MRHHCFNALDAAAKVAKRGERVAIDLALTLSSRLCKNLLVAPGATAARYAPGAQFFLPHYGVDHKAHQP